MKFSANYTALLCLFVSSAYATEELTPQTFKEYTSSGQNGMVKFYQSWVRRVTFIHCFSLLDYKERSIPFLYFF